MTHDSRLGDHQHGSKQTSPPSHLHKKRRKEKFLDCIGEPYNYVRGESALWVAVITQAMMDALSHARSAEALYHKHEAIRWLTGNSQDFMYVCLAAGFDPAYIRRKAKRALATPTFWRAEPGKGKRYLERKAYRQKLKTGGAPPCKPVMKDRLPPMPAITGIKGGVVITGAWG